ncbi:MAG TPA: sulfite exporter TauE/SafE family protein [Bacteroidales bacterium]|nr:sulfite exporter TauE/SafE family protein [Bacteroidales bacterium]
MEQTSLYILLGIIILLSSIIRGTTGFGLAITSLPFLLMILPLKEVVVLIAFINLAFSIVHLVRERGSINRRDFLLMAIFSMVGVATGVFILRASDEEVLKITCGILIVLYGILVYNGISFRFRHSAASYTLSGLIGGILAGSIAIGGLPAALILSSSGLSKDKFRYSMSIFFLITYLFSASAYGLAGMIDLNILSMVAVSLPFMFIGLFAGSKLAKRIPEKKFSRLGLLLIIIMGIVIVLETLVSNI